MGLWHTVKILLRIDMGLLRWLVCTELNIFSGGSFLPSSFTVGFDGFSICHEGSSNIYSRIFPMLSQLFPFLC